MIQVTFQRHAETPWEEGPHHEANHNAAYFGTYSVDNEAMTVTHNIEGATSPNRRLQPVGSFQSDD